jgi:formylglycine-generating enzyme required for sulfatase activity
MVVRNSSRNPPVRVYVSSPVVYNSGRVKVVEDAVISAGMVPVRAERLITASQPTVQERQECIRSCDWLIGILAYEYGQVPPGQPPGEEHSIVEIEYDTAVEHGMPTLMFVLHESVDVNISRDFDPGAERWEKQAKLSKFKAKLEAATRFRDEDLGDRVLKAIGEQRAQQPEARAAGPAVLSSLSGRPPVAVLAFANDRTLHGRQLRNLPAERRSIERHLLSHAELKVLPDVLKKDIWDAFACVSYVGRIQVFHFGGHASSSWLAFEDEAGRPVHACADVLARFLGRQDGLVLVFLNGCSTQQQIRNLRRGIRAVVATTEDIVDEVAAEFAGRFYAELATKPLEQAFLDAVDFMELTYRRPRDVIRRELQTEDSQIRDCWPWVLDCDQGCRMWRLGQAAPSRDHFAYSSEGCHVSGAWFQHHAIGSGSTDHGSPIMETSVVPVGFDDLIELDKVLRDHPSMKSQRWWQARMQRKEPFTIEAPRGGVELVFITGGRFWIGTPNDEEDRCEREGPQHEVELEPFCLARTPVTNAQYRKYLEENSDVRKPKYWDDHRYNQSEQPVVGVSWRDARAYCRWAGLDLPTEAQWEYACRGAVTGYLAGDDEGGLVRVGWNDSNSGGRLHAVREIPPNLFGLYDMHGNVFEWCEDEWFLDYERAVHRRGDGLRMQPVGRAERVSRGGSWCHGPGYARSTFRYYYGRDNRGPFVGFRPAYTKRRGPMHG